MAPRMQDPSDLRSPLIACPSAARTFYDPLHRTRFLWLTLPDEPGCARCSRIAVLRVFPHDLRTSNSYLSSRSLSRLAPSSSRPPDSPPRGQTQRVSPVPRVLQRECTTSTGWRQSTVWDLGKAILKGMAATPDPVPPYATRRRPTRPRRPTRGRYVRQSSLVRVVASIAGLRPLRA